MVILSPLCPMDIIISVYFSAKPKVVNQPRSVRPAAAAAKAASISGSKGSPELKTRQEVGNDVILHCSANREVHLCRWKTPYLNTYIVGEGIYVERGRIQWLGSDPNYDCTIRVANLDLRDAGTWVCEIGSSTKESFQVQTKEFVIDIESEF